MDLSRIVRGLALVLVPVGVFLVLGEITLRLYLTTRIFYDVEMSRYAQLLKIESPNPKIGHVHRPGGEAHLMGVDVAINSVGLRDDEPLSDVRDVRRLVFLGDSLTFGWGVREEESFAHRLEVALNEDRPTEVLNFGTGNYNTTQEVELFLEKGLDYAPDEVVVFYFINDAEPVPRRSPWSFLANFRIITFYWSRMKQLSARFFPEQTFREYYAGLYEEGQPGWRETRRAFQRLAELCQSRGIGLRVVLLPELHELDDYPFASEYRKVANFLESLGVQVLDLTPAFSDVRDPQSLWVSPDDAHPNAGAHRRIADASLKFLSDPPEPP